MPIVQTSSTDVIRAVRSHLLAADPVSAIVEDRIHGAHIMDPDAGSVEYPMLILEFDGGLSGVSSGFQAATVNVWAYSRTSGGDAIGLYDAAYGALHHQGFAPDGIAIAGYCMETSRPTQGWNEATKSYYARGIFLVRAAPRQT